jgi:hypothetical protein
MSVTCDVGIDQWAEILKGETIDRGNIMSQRLYPRNAPKLAYQE